MKVTIEGEAQELRALFGNFSPLHPVPLLPPAPAPSAPKQKLVEYLISFVPSNGAPAFGIGKITKDQKDAGELKKLANRALVLHGVVESGTLHVFEVAPNKHATRIQELPITAGKLA